jgi:DNA-binding MarR family transcriptional regulator
MATSLEVLTELLRLAPRLERLRVRGLERDGLTTPRLRVLSILHQDGPLTSAELARRLGITPRAVTALVDGLEEHELVLRRPHPSDRRATLVALSTRGSRTYTRLASGYGQLADELLAGTSDRQLAAGLAIIRRLDRGLDARRA